ncbi:C4-dicarboxylate ABC transporter permease [Thioclava sp. SK-1]|nr:C4-dicarboxylate ABC transporter permease [Thioclava sp. SK-1]
MAPVDRITAFGNLIAGLCLLGIFVLILAEVTSRNLFGASLGFSWDYSAYLMGASFMLGSASALKSGAHVRVTAALEKMPPRIAHGVEIAACAVAIMCCAVLAWALIDMTWLSAMRGSTSSTVMRTPLVYPQSLVAFGAVVLCAQCVAQLLRLMRGETLSTGIGLE